MAKLATGNTPTYRAKWKISRSANSDSSGYIRARGSEYHSKRWYVMRTWAQKRVRKNKKGGQPQPIVSRHHVKAPLVLEIKIQLPSVISSLFWRDPKRKSSYSSYFRSN